MRRSSARRGRLETRRHASRLHRAAAERRRDAEGRQGVHARSRPTPPTSTIMSRQPPAQSACLWWTEGWGCRQTRPRRRLMTNPRRESKTNFEVHAQSHPQRRRQPTRRPDTNRTTGRVSQLDHFEEVLGRWKDPEANPAQWIQLVGKGQEGLMLRWWNPGGSNLLESSTKFWSQGGSRRQLFASSTPCTDCPGKFGQRDGCWLRTLRILFARREG